ncbi:MAG: hypothetical protein AAF485_01975 [Chloroflexota bacterium]
MPNKSGNHKLGHIGVALDSMEEAINLAKKGSPEAQVFLRTDRAKLFSEVIGVPIEIAWEQLDLKPYDELIQFLDTLPGLDDEGYNYLGQVINILEFCKGT